MSTMWVVYLTYDLAVEEELLIEWGEQLEGYDASVANVPGRGVLVTMWVDADDLVRAGLHAVEIAGKVLDVQPAGMEVVPAAVHEANAEQSWLPDLVGAPEVAEILGGITRQRVYQLQESRAFPKPLYRLRTGPVWDRRAIEHFDREWTRKPGRPKKAVPR